MIELVSVGLDNPRGDTPLLADVSLQVPPGEVALIVGASGTGTSRLVAAALGEQAIASGRIEVLGRDVSKLRRSSLRLLRRHVGIVPQELCLLEDRSAQANVVMPLEIDGIPRSVSVARAAIVLEALGLDDVAAIAVEKLAPAQRQRVAVARALVREPEILIADHPTSMQDPHGADLVCTAIEAAAQRGTTCLVLGRCPTLRTIASLYKWRMLGLVDGVLKALDEIELEGTTIDEVLIGMESAPVRSPISAAISAIDIDTPELSGPVIDNVIPFRQAGAR